MALVSNIQLQDGAVKPPNLDTNLKYTAAGLTATEAIAVGTVPVSTSGAITVKSANDIRNWIQTTKTDGNVEIYMSNDARPDWALRVAGTADNAFVIANSYGSNCTAQFPAFSIGGAGAVGLGKTGATNILDIAYKNSATGGIQLTETQNSVGAKLIAEATSASIGSTSNHKLGFRVNGTTVAAFNTSTQFGIGTDSPGATLDVRGAAIFNEAGAAVDFRIEGDAEQNLFFVDGSADAIGMGTATPVDTSRLHVMGTDGDAAATHSGDAMLIVENCGTTFLELATGNGNHAGLTFSDAAAATRGAVLYDHGTGLGGAADSLYFQTAGSIRAVLQSDGDFGIGTLAPGADLHVAGVDDPEIRLQGATDGDPQINFYQSTNCRGTIKYKDTGDNFVMDSNGKVTLQTSSTPRLVITNAGCVGIGTNAVASACGAQLDIFSAGATTGLMLRSGNTSAASATIRGEGYRNDGDNEQVMQLVGRNSNNSIDLGIFEVAAETKHCEGKLELKTFDGSSMTTKMIIRAEGNIGVGTATPAGKFHVEGSCAVFNPVSANAGKLEIIQGSTHADSIRLNATGTTNMYLEYRGYNGHQFVVNTTEGMRLTSTGLGIGTATPGDSLHVQGGFVNVAGNPSANTISSNGTGKIGGLTSNGLFMYGKGSTYDVVIGNSTTNFALAVPTGGGTTPDVYIINSLGIGTSVPDNKLHIHDTTNDNGINMLQLFHDRGASNVCQLDLHYIKFMQRTNNAAGTVQARIAQVLESQVHSSRASGLAFYTENAGTVTEKLRINNSGDVGIGTTSPSGRLQVCGNTVLNTTFVEGKLTVQDGNYGIGGEARGDVSLGTIAIMGCSPAAGCVLPITFNMTAASSRARAAIAGVDLGSVGYCMGLAFYTRGAADGTALTTADEKVRILHNGNVGIGTTVPNAKLGINFNPALVNGLELTDSRGTNCRALFTASGGVAGLYTTTSGSYGTAAITIGSTGLIGIGTAAPTSTLHIQNNTANTYPLEIDAADGSNLFGVFETSGGDAQVWVRDASGDPKVLLAASGCSFFLGGNVGIGTSPRGSVFFEGGHSASLQIEGTTPSNSGISLIRNNANFGPSLILARSCGTSRGSNTLVAHSQSIGGISFQANDGTEFVTGATIGAKVGCTAAANCMSGELQFFTNCGSDGGIVERMRLQQFGDLQIGAPFGECDSKFIICQQTSTKAAMRLQQSNTDQVVEIMTTGNASYASIMSNITSVRAAGTDHDYIRMNSNGGTDVEFRFRGDGTAFADGSFENSGADYQEYFESTSGVAAEVGRVVVLDGDKVRYYNSTTDSTDDIMGVTRPEADNKNSAVVGNVAWNFWTDKYLTDDWGVYLREDVNVWNWTDDDGGEHGVYERDEIAKDPTWTPPTGAVMTVQSIRKKNPEYNESLSENYQSRAERDEWWLIGLLGQIQVKAGEPVNPRWIKMKDISDAVELYYIR